MTSSLRSLLRPFRQHAKRLAAALALALITLAAGTGLLGVSGWFITSAALAGAGVAFNLFAPSALVRGLSMVRIVSRYSERLVGHDVTLRLLADLRVWLFDRLVPLAPGRLAGLRGGDLVSRLTGDVDALDTVFLQAIVPLATTLLLATVLAIVFWFALPSAALALVVGVMLATLVVPAWLVWRSLAPGQAQVQAQAAMRATVLDCIEGHADLTALGVTDGALQGFAGAAHDASRARLRQASITADGLAAVQVVSGLCVLTLLALGLPALAAGTLNGPWLAGMLLATVGLFETTGPIARGAARLGAAVAAARRMLALAEMHPAVSDPVAAMPLPGDGALTFEDVVFAHGAGRPVLSGLTMQVAPGERVAIVGPSGIGKSTLLNLALRIEDPQQGQVRFGGIDLRDARQAELHQRIAVLGQDAPVFLGTIRANLQIGAPLASDDDLWRVLDAARLGTHVRQLPQGLDTWTGEGGYTLSAGQARRLCLARALLSPAPVLALDEPTAGLDRATELEFLTDLAVATAGRTVLLVTHAQIPDGTVDRILRLEGGRIAAEERVMAPR